MQYLVSVIDDTAGSATLGDMAAIDAVNDRLEAELKLAAEESKHCNRKVEVRPFQ